jgi:hypothetical protein
MKRVALADRAPSFAAVCSESSVQVAAAGVSRRRGHLWWRQSSGMPVRTGCEGGRALELPVDEGWVGGGLTVLGRD